MNTTTTPVPKKLLKIDDLVLHFKTRAGTVQAVDGVDFELDTNRAVVILGESGCGKSVTSLSIMKLIPQPPGEIMPGSSIKLRGEELVTTNEKRMREIRGNNRMAALDRVAVLAALNLAHELQLLRNEGDGRDREIVRTLDDLHRKLDGLFDGATPR